MSHPPLRYVLLVAMATLSSTWSYAQKSQLPIDDPNRIYWFKVPVSLGAEAFKIEPLGKHFFLLACLEDNSFDRLQVSRVRSSQFVIDKAGDLWQHYPRELTFRVTATAMNTEDLQADTETIQEAGDLNSFLLGLRFQLKIFRGLERTIIQPISIRMIGLPANVPGEERIYRVSFATGEFPVDARLVMEVLSPDGKLLTRFHLELL
ncbi:MAG TPA: hypothetical protein VF135_00615 [Terriglobales bacterium]